MIRSLRDLRAGDIGFGPIHGATGDLIVGPAQLALAAAEPGLIWRQGWRAWYRVRHVIVITEASPESLHQPRAVQAMPSGAEEIVLRPETHWTPEWAYVRPDYTEHGLVWDQPKRVAEAARSFIGVPYNFATYAAIPAHRAHLPVPHLDRFIASRNDMMCSQLADQALSDAGWHVFDDGRLSQDVTPSELFRAMIVQPTECIVRPEKDGGGWHTV